MTPAGSTSLAFDDTILDADDLSGINLRGVDLRGRDLLCRNLTGADLTGADLTGARLTGSNLTGAILRGATIDGANLVGCDLTDADLTECSGIKAVMGQCDLHNGILFAANLTGATLSAATAVNADFRAACLDDTRILDADVSGSDFSRASLRDADLTGACVREAVFKEANLQGACLRGLREFERADWIDVAVLEVDFSGAYLVRRAIMDENYLHEFRSRDQRHALLYRLWKATSDCGRSFARWGILTVIVAIVFGLLYTQVSLDYGDHQTWLSPFYFSVVTLTTLGYGDVLPRSPAAQTLVLFEVVVGYVMLGGVLSIFATRMGRRAD